MRRTEAAPAAPSHVPAPLGRDSGVAADEVQDFDRGSGPLFHRVYRTRIRDSPMSAGELMAAIKSSPNRAAPKQFARFQMTRGRAGELSVGDEFVVRMPGPWDGPVRVIDVRPQSFRFATLDGHLEAGQIEFRARRDGDLLLVEIESWARSSSGLVDLLYHRLRMAKEIQAHMWISFLERVIKLSGGRMTGGIEIRTERLDPATLRR